MAIISASLFMPALRRLDPERAHRMAMWALRLGLLRDRTPSPEPVLATEALGLRFRNPIGLAAGFDKNAEAIGPLIRLGFGFIETGTVTPRPQSGNPPPRLFRLVEDDAIVNRMGFNNHGMDAYVARLRNRPSFCVPVGANIGINRDGAEPERDYALLLAAVAPHVDYVVINVSSPNTPGLRDLQGAARLGAILRAWTSDLPHSPPVMIKIAPDLSPGGLASVVEISIEHGVQGLVISNTSVERPSTLRSKHASEAGGLSGRPLFASSTALLARAYLLAHGRLTLVGVGGIFSGQDALTKIKAGATLVQLYTALVFNGPAIVTRIRIELASALRREGFVCVADAVGVEASRLAEGIS